MNYPKQHCDESRLAVLLRGDEESDEFRVSAAHVESCDVCCRRLTELAADDETWCDISESLRAESVNFAATSKSDTHLTRQLEFLSPPSHPEMLGRLGRYEVERVVGAGGMGIVLKAHDSELNRPVAIKVLAPHLAHSGAARQRFAREGRAAAAIVHEHVVAIHNVETDAEVPFLVMQLVPGRSLQSRVDEFGPLSVTEILRIGRQAANGLSAAHAQGVVHRDIKPSNILLENDVERVLLTDFGLARVADDASMTRSGIVAGTPLYMSPEQATGAHVDQRSDLFSLGAVLYFMATGHSPFRAERTMAILNRICNDQHRPAWQVNPNIPLELSDLIDCLLEKKPNRRLASAEQAQAALSELMQQASTPNKFRLRSAFRRTWRRHRRVISGMMAVLSLAAVIGFWRPSPNEPSSETSPHTPAHTERSNAQPYDLVTQPQREFAAAVTDVQRELSRIEQQLVNDSRFPQQGTASWDAELADIKHELTQLEESLSFKPLTQGRKQ